MGLRRGWTDDENKMSIADRRDSFCGKMSACSNLRQYGIAYSLTALHTVSPDSESFRQDLRQFVGTCRIVRGLRGGARIGMLGARPAAFITVRYSEKLLEKAGISIEVLDLSEAFGRTSRLKDSDTKVQKKLDQIRAYVSTEGVPGDSLLKMSKFALVMEDWIEKNDLVATAVGGVAPEDRVLDGPRGNIIEAERAAVRCGPIGAEGAVRRDHIAVRDIDSSSIVRTRIATERASIDNLFGARVEVRPAALPATIPVKGATHKGYVTVAVVGIQPTSVIYRGVFGEHASCHDRGGLEVEIQPAPLIG